MMVIISFLSILSPQNKKTEKRRDESYILLIEVLFSQEIFSRLLLRILYLRALTNKASKQQQSINLTFIVEQSTHICTFIMYSYVHE